MEPSHISHMTASAKEDIKLRLAELGWEVRVATTSGAVVGRCGKDRVMVSFGEGGEPMSVIIAHVGRGGGILSGKWRGLRGLPTPESAARRLAK